MPRCVRSARPDQQIPAVFEEPSEPLREVAILAQAVALTDRDRQQGIRPATGIRADREAAPVGQLQRIVIEAVVVVPQAALAAPRCD
jgi:hypothetical protein